ncbi:hypothetical protein [Nonomuraea fuscirosea]|uniref:hypothetical protein n=1 Tax=Nonomuraea fuscirosea TaxID=1291556 RepID=UPI003422ED95
MMLRILRALVAYAVLLVAVLGFPLLLYKFVGPPFPNGLPSFEQVRDVLTAPDDGTLIIAVLVHLLWGLWAQFTYTVICEVVAKLRGRHLTPQLPGLRTMHRLAAYLVASATLAVLVPQASNAATHPPVVAMAPLHPLGQAAGIAAQPEKPIYQVQEGDSLWEIADEQLGEPRRWPEIWKLNADSSQPSEQRFTDPNLIQPGWRLELPTDGSEQAGTNSATEQSLGAHTPSTSHGSTPSPPPRTDAQGPAESQLTETVELSSGSLVALAYAAGISTAFMANRLYRRRRRVPPGPGKVVTITADPEPVPEVAELLRAHRRSFTAKQRPMPSEGELVRQADSIDVPQHVVIGQDPEGEDVRLDLDGLGVGLVGPGAPDVMRYLLLDLLRQSSNYRTEIIICTELAEDLFGVPGDELGKLAVALPGLQVTDSREGAIRQFEETVFLRRRMVLERESSDMNNLRQKDPGEALPAVLLVAESQDPAAAVTLPPTRALGAGALFLGPWRNGMTCSVTAVCTVLTVEGRGAHVIASARLFHVGVNEAAAHLRQLASPQQSEAPETAPNSGESRPEWAGPALIRLVILGHPTVYVRNREHPVALSWLQLNTLIYLAVHHRTGVTREQLTTALWPDDSGKDIHNALRHLRNALASASEYKNTDAKRASFIGASTTKDSAAYRLDPQLISVDLWDFEAALEDVKATAGSAEHVTSLAKAADLCTGQLAQGFSAEWIEDQRYPLTRSQADILTQLADLLAEEEPERALLALERALKLDPDTEETYFRIIGLQLQLGRRDHASRTAELLRQHQRGLGVAGDYQTEQRLGLLLETSSVDRSIAAKP